MASVSEFGGGRRRITFARGNRRVVLHLGRVPKRVADSICGRVEAILACEAAGVPLDAETARWLGTVSDELAGRLAKAGLMAERRRADLEGFLHEYIRTMPVKPSTKISCEVAANRIVAFYGSRELHSIGPTDADGFSSWIRQYYAAATAGRTLGRARQFFRAAVRLGYLDRNPFAEIKAGCPANSDRCVFIDRAAIAHVLDACPSDDWRRIVALARFGGLRCPSEITRLRWADVRADRFWVTSPKTAGHGKAGRWVPLFPELAHFLAQENEPKQENVVARPAGNWRTQFIRIIRRAGLEPWPRLFHNLRASRETELAAEYPLHVAAAWIGNTAVVAARHYLTVREDDFARARRRAPSASATAGLVTPPATENATHSTENAPCDMNGRASVLAWEGLAQPQENLQFSDGRARRAA